MNFIIEGFKKRHLPYSKEYLNRIQEEYELICQKDFSSYFLIQKMMVDEARRISKQLLGWGTGHEAVGPGRGSAVGSLICYCLGITDVDPIKHDLLFSRFLSPARGGKSMKLNFTIEPLPKKEPPKPVVQEPVVVVDECPFDAD
jgi:DNA polymerase-3 subunit alpha